DSRNKLWIGTIEGGLTVLDPETDRLQNFKHEPGNPTSLSSNTVSSICEDEFGNIWVGTGHFAWPYGRGLNKLDPNTGRFLHYRHDPDDPSSISSDNISSLLIDRDGVFWIGTVDNHLNAIPLAELLSNRKPRFTHYSNFSRRCINSIDEDRLGNIWISLFGRAVYKYNRLQNPFIWYRHIRGNSNSLSSNGVGMVQVDKSGNVWFGGRGGVLDCYDPKTGQFTHYSYNPDNPSGLNSDIVTSI
ncbi:MAG: hypothetical protein GWN00_26925, partial [Aliifodinibius sp.]|nr:hypothetical protein [Fodinibius sp.]NIV15305.1 hypothetical protein [Fodinibius sp.]NIY28305.1 hypothetical protein [Fodinibius sp.]